MRKTAVIETQLDFYRKGKAGCLFVAHAAANPAKFEWRLSVCKVHKGHIEKLIRSAIELPEVSTQSMIFPSIVTDDDLKELLSVLQETPLVVLEQEEKFEGAICLGYRAKVNHLKSWMTGFGNFDFFPKTRQSVFTEIMFRSKARPPYEKVMKKTPKGIIHLADMDMKGMSDNKFKSLWYGSFDNTENILGHKPNLKSAAKTTFAVPISMWKAK